VKKLLYIFILVFLHDELFSQSTGFIFNHLKKKDGLSDNYVNCFLKDSRGRFWIGTRNGLNHFDGSHFYTYKKTKDSNSVINGTIVSLCEDKNGFIWGTTEGGIFRYNPFINSFKKISSPVRDLEVSYNNILCDADGNIWATSLWSLMKYNFKAEKFEEVLVTNEHTGKRRTNEYSIKKNGMLLDSSGKKIWLTTSSGLIYYDITGKKKVDLKRQMGNPLFANQNTAALAPSSSGHFWFFNNDTKEIISFNPSTQTIVRKINIRQEMPNALGATLFEDKNNRLWFSSGTSDCLVIDYLHGNKIEKIEYSEEDKMSITNGHFWSVYEDEDGTLWFGTISGISKCNPEKNLYKAHYLHDKIVELRNTSISIITEDPKDKSWWLGTLSNQLIHYYPDNGQYESYDLKKAKPDRRGQRPGGMYNICPIGDYVVIANTNGIWQLRKGTKEIVPYSFLPPGYEVFVGRSAVVQGDSICYFTDVKKILRSNMRNRTATYIEFPAEDSADIKYGMGFIFLNSANRIWACSNLGRLVYIKDDNKLSSVKLVKDEEKEFSGYFNTLDFDEKGNIWVVSTGFGLYRFSPSTGDIKYWDETDGQLNSAIQKNKVDGAGNIWLFFDNNVSVFSPEKNIFFHFTIPYSENISGYYNAVNRLANGNIVGTINNEVFEFIPGRINLKPVKRKPELSMINVSGKDIMISDEEKLILQPDENTVRFRFGLLTDAEQFPYEFEYRLDGAEDSWIKSSAINEAVYNNLSPGTYTFRLLARGKNNGWQSEEKTFAITIKAPFYKTKWFWLLIGSLLIVTLIFFYRFRLNKQKLILTLETKAQQLEKEKTMVMYESLKQQLNPHFLFNSLTSLSGLIVTDQQVAGDFLEQMSGIYRYILKNGDNETVSLKDEIEFVQLYIDLQQTRFKKGLQVNVNVPDEYLHYKIAPVTLQNLIENAIKHNIIDIASPLVIDIFVEGDYLAVKNNLQKKNVVETSNKKGLVQFISLYRYLSDLPVVIEETEKEFLIKIPLI
jgi:ligand-binding sensor domain-containing protein